MGPKKKYFAPTNDLSYHKILGLYEDISNNVHEKNADFVLPQNPKFSAFGNKIAFCQLINTWFRKNTRSKVRIYDNHYAKNNDEEVIKLIKHFIDEAEIHTLLALSHGIEAGIWGYSNKETNYTEKFVTPLKNRIIFDYKELSRISSRNFFSSEYYQIHPDFFDENFFDNNLTFYTKIGKEYFIKKQDRIQGVSQKLFNRIEAFGTETTLPQLKEVHTFFYEIFDNTFKWGRNNWLKQSDFNHDIFCQRSNRMFYISSKNFTNLDYPKEKNITIETELLDFAKRYSKNSQWGSDIKILELSILDNGIGIVQGYTRSDVKTIKLEISEEYNKLIESFEFGKTSDLSFQANVRGIGLYKVIKNAKNIFLIVRTGHLYLYRDFGKNPFTEGEKFHLFSASAKTEKGTNINDIEKYTWSEGTLFTFIIPLLEQNI